MSNAAFCRVYNKQALRMLVAENTLEEEAREKRAKKRRHAERDADPGGARGPNSHALSPDTPQP